MSEWKKFSCSEKQLEEMLLSKNDILIRYTDGNCKLLSEFFVSDREALIQSQREYQSISEYIVCEEHPLAKMITQQSHTGQPVYIQICQKLTKSDEYELAGGPNNMELRHLYTELYKFYTELYEWLTDRYNYEVVLSGIGEDLTYVYYVYKTNKPDWYIDDAKYSFTMFDLN